MEKLVTMLMVLMFLGCGAPEEAVLSDAENAENEAENVDSNIDSNNTTNTTINTTNTSSNVSASLPEDGSGFSYYFEVAGYISPINITVNDQQYTDSEDFYTQELNRLQEEVEQEYPEHTLNFDANVGLNHFKNGMYVFLVAASEQGVASETYVNSNGKFTFIFDKIQNSHKRDLYSLRASKRISLRLTKDNEIVSWCYNMYAEKETTLEQTPVILRHFRTVLTKYQCSDSNQGISIPATKKTKSTKSFEEDLMKDAQSN